MNLDELQSVQSKERQASSLQHLRPSFYQDAGEFVQELRDRRDTAAAEADDPFDSEEVRRLTDDIKSAERTVEAIYERRVGKVVKMASIAAADMPYDDDGLTREEERLFETLVTSIEENRESVLSILDGDVPGLTCRRPDETTDRAAEEDVPPGAGRPTEPATRSTEDTGTKPTSPGVDRGVDATGPGGEGEPQSAEMPSPEDGLNIGGAMGGASASDDAGTPPELNPASETRETVPPDPAPGTGTSPGPGGDSASESASESPPAPRASDAGAGGAGARERGDVSRATVRITAEVGDIFGVDGRAYDLSSDDVVTLPEENATILAEQGHAERLE